MLPVTANPQARPVPCPAALRVQQRDVPVAVLARLLDCGAEMSYRRAGVVVLHFRAAAWQALVPARRDYVLKSLWRYRNVYAVIGGAPR